MERLEHKLKLINGKKYSFADVILNQRRKEDSIIISSFGFSVVQIEKLLKIFKNVQVIVDESHSKLNENMFERVCKLNKKTNNFILKVASIHAKLAVFGNQCILTSANLTSNQKIESYFFTTIDKVEGISDIIDFFDSIPEDSYLQNREFHKQTRDSINKENDKFFNKNIKNDFIDNIFDFKNDDIFDIKL